MFASLVKVLGLVASGATLDAAVRAVGGDARLREVAERVLSRLEVRA
jgi:hypothetical protein